MHGAYRVLLAIALGMALLVGLMKVVQAKDSDTSPMTPSDVCILDQRLKILNGDEASGTDSGDVTEQVFSHCDSVAHTDPFYIDQAENLIERNANDYCAYTGPAHKADCLSQRREKSTESIRQQIRNRR